MINWLRMAWSGPVIYMVAALCLSGIFASCEGPGDNLDVDALAQEINQSVMCPVCPGESIDQSQHPLAVQ
ncbi:MAG: hypothetical protein QGF12_00070, partial [SAR202 cluster bacterium]|nr:hypothetical protein [SAR202 cluster bacterium]